MNTTKTPGYNSRLTIRFSTDKNGKPIAHFWSGGTFGQGRYFPIGYDKAKLLVAQGQADQH